jgi:hypothetical protein
MPTYPVINKNTGETKELSMTISEWEKWKEENFKDGWDRDWSQGCASACEVGEWKDKLSKSHPSFNEVLKKAKKAGGMNSKIDTL